MFKNSIYPKTIQDLESIIEHSTDFVEIARCKSLINVLKKNEELRNIEVSKQSEKKQKLRK